MVDKLKQTTQEKATVEDINLLTGKLQQAIGTSQLYHIPCIRDTVEQTAEKYENTLKNSKAYNHVAVKDAYGNNLAAIGTNDRVQSFTNYGFSNDTLNFPLWLSLYNDSWVFRKAIDKPAQDQVNCGFTLHGKSDYNIVYRAYEKYKTDFIRLLKWGALFGGSVAVFMFDGFKPEDYQVPLKDKLKDIKAKAKAKGKEVNFKLYITDRWYGCAQSMKTVSSMRDIDYGKPYSYEITFANGKSWTVHHSYVLRYEHRDAPRIIKMGYLQGWGYAEGAHILNELARDDQLKSSITSLVNKALIEVIKMKGMRSIFMGIDKGSLAQLEKRVEMVTYGRTYNSLTFLDKDDEYSQYNMTGLSGLSELLEKNMWLVAAACDMPGILFGDLKGGLAQESDALKRYAITIKNRCNEFFRPALNKFIKILFLLNDINESPDFDFISLVKDEDNENKIKSIGNLSNMLNTLVQNGIISKYEYARNIKNFINNDAIDLTIRDEVLDALKLEEQQGVIDIIDNIAKKRKIELKKPNFNNPYEQKETMNPVESGELSEESNVVEANVEEIETPTETPVEPTGNETGNETGGETGGEQ